MSWKFVLNTNKLMLEVGRRNATIDDATIMCARVGYLFFCFNGKVYFLANGISFPTGITVEDLY